jgi:hypothetical protein
MGKENGRGSINGRVVADLFEGELPPQLLIREREWGWVVRGVRDQRIDDKRGDESEWRVFNALYSPKRRLWLQTDRVVWVGKNSMEDGAGLDVVVEKCCREFYGAVGIDGFKVQVKSSLSGAADCLEKAERESLERMSRTERRAGTKNGSNGGPRNEREKYDLLRERYAAGYRYLVGNRLALVIAGEWSDDNILAQLTLQLMGMSRYSEDDFLRLFQAFDREMVEAYRWQSAILQELLWGLDYQAIFGNGGNGKGH